VWVFTAGQGGKASERKALSSIRDEGRRVLGVLNKADQLSAEDLAEVMTFLGETLRELVEAVVPVSARRALLHKLGPTAAAPSDDAAAMAGAAVVDRVATSGNWGDLEAALEQRFFAQARQLKRQACERRLRGVLAEATAALTDTEERAARAAVIAQQGRELLEQATQTFLKTTILAERRALSEAVSALYRRAAREVLELVRPRRLPFSAHSATTADRDYLIALLEAGYDDAIETARARVSRELTQRAAVLQEAASALEGAVGIDVREDLARAARDGVQLATAQVFERARAYLRGFLEGGYVEAFFRNDVPRLDLSEDAVYHALVRGAPDLDRDIGAPLERAATELLAGLGRRLEYWSGVVAISEFDLRVGLRRMLEDIERRL
jgi:hypothetical protein